MENTKEKLIYASYELISQSATGSFSLSALAKKVGLSKPAIFRHFTNKKALLDAVGEDFFSNLFSLVKDIVENAGENQVDGFLEKIFLFFLTPPYHYFSYIIRSIAEKEKGEIFFLEGLKNQGIDIEKFFAVKQDKKMGKMKVASKENFAKFSYIRTSILIFMFSFMKKKQEAKQNNITNEAEKALPDMQDCSIKMDDCVNGIEKYSSDVARMLEQGLSWLPPISKKRIRELQDIYIKPRGNDIFDRLFCALTAIMQDKGMKGVTIEEVANKVGMAKSSLYNYFETKIDMISSLMIAEIKSLIDTIQAASTFAKTRTEKLVIYMYALLSYIMKKPYSLVAFKWLRFNDIRQSLKMSKQLDSFKLDLFTLEEKNRFGFIFGEDTLEAWLTGIAVTLAVNAKEYDIETEDTKQDLEDMIGYIMGGVDLFSQNERQVLAVSDVKEHKITA